MKSNRHDTDYVESSRIVFLSFNGFWTSISRLHNCLFGLNCHHSMLQELKNTTAESIHIKFQNITPKVNFTFIKIYPCQLEI